MISPGVAYAISAPLLYGASIPLLKGLLGLVTPWMLAGLLFLSAGLGLATIRLVGRTWGWKPAVKPLAGQDWLWLGAAILAGEVIGTVLLMVGLANSPASSASLLLNLEVVLTVLIAWFVFQEQFSWRTALGVGVIIAGSGLLSAENSEFGVTSASLAIAGSCLGCGQQSDPEDCGQRASADCHHQKLCCRGN